MDVNELIKRAQIEQFENHNFVEAEKLYSNKFLVHLNDLELAASLKKQVDLLCKGGILFHTFWFGDKQEMMEDLLFNYINQERLSQIIPPELEVVEVQVYKEMEENDSVYIILKR